MNSICKIRMNLLYLIKLKVCLLCIKAIKKEFFFVFINTWNNIYCNQKKQNLSNNIKIKIIIYIS